MSVIIHVAESAFISILVSAIESFPSKFLGRRKPPRALPEGEVYGLLFGQRITKNTNTIYHVSISTPMQILSVKTPGEVTPSIKHFDRIKTVVEAFPTLQFLGTFHSHPWPKEGYKGISSSDFSPIDQKSALSDAGSFGDELIEIIIGLTYLDKVVKKTPEIRWSCTQNYCGNYKYTLAGYATDSLNGKLDRVDNFICPTAAGIGNYDLNP